MESWICTRASRRFRPSARDREATRLDLILIALLGALLFIRIVADDRSPLDSRHSSSLNLSGMIAAVLMLLALAMLLRGRQGLLTTAVIVVWLCIWTAIAIATNGASGETIREGVREASVIALAVIVYNAAGAVTVPIAARIVQFIGVVPAVLALSQLATHTGMDVAGNIRAHGTLAHPNSAAMFFAIATTASLWLYLAGGRHPYDAALVAIFAAALIATFSIDGLITLAAMLVVLGATQPGALRVKLIPWAIAVAVVAIFLATPLGSRRVSGETATSLAAAERGETTSTFDTRLYRWKTLLREWERRPVFGQGIGTTTTTEGTRANPLNFLLPHNEYIRYLVETGVVGVIILLTGLALLIRALFRRRALDLGGGGGGGSPASLAIAVVVGCLVNSLADNTLLNSPTGYAAALIIAAALATRGAEPKPIIAQPAT